MDKRVHALIRVVWNQVRRGGNKSHITSFRADGWSAASGLALAIVGNVCSEWPARIRGSRAGIPQKNPARENVPCRSQVGRRRQERYESSVGADRWMQARPVARHACIRDGHADGRGGAKLPGPATSVSEKDFRSFGHVGTNV